ncbi:unnamed protein product [Effrenium voratum]|nr:unnamed protein product [Effrenium voratum]
MPARGAMLRPRASRVSAFDAENSARALARLRRVARKVIADQRKSRAERGGVALKDIAVRSRILYEEHPTSLEGQEADFVRGVLSANPLLFKVTWTLRGLAKAGPPRGEAVTALHKVKLYTARFLWARQIRPLKEKLDQAERLYSQLKERFSATRCEYLKEVSELRDHARPERNEEDDYIRRPSRSDIRLFYDPVTCLSEDELSLVTKALTEKLKMMLEKDPSLQVNTSQLQSMLGRHEGAEMRRLREQLQQRDVEVLELHKQLEGLQELFAESVPGGGAALAELDRQRATVDFLTKQVEELKDHLKAEAAKGCAEKLETLQLEQQELRAAYESEVDDRLKLQKQEEELQAQLRTAASAQATSEARLEDLMMELAEVQLQREELRRKLHDLTAKAAERRSSLRSHKSSVQLEDSPLPNEVDGSPLQSSPSLSASLFKMDALMPSPSMRKAKVKVVAPERSESQRFMVEKLKEENANVKEENAGLLLECEAMKERLGELRHQQAARLSEEACQAAGRLRQVAQAVEFASEVSTGGSGNANLPSAELEEALSQLRHRAEEVAKCLEQATNPAEVESLQRDARELEVTIFAQEVMLDACRVTDDADRTQLPRIQAFCNAALSKLMDSASANVVLVRRINDMQSRMREAIQRPGESTAAVETGLKELEEVHEEDVFASDVFSHDEQEKRLAQQEVLERAVQRLHEGVAPTPRSVAKMEMRVQEARAAFVAVAKLAKAQPEEKEPETQMQIPGSWRKPPEVPKEKVEEDKEKVFSLTAPAPAWPRPERVRRSAPSPRPEQEPGPGVILSPRGTGSGGPRHPETKDLPDPFQRQVSDPSHGLVLSPRGLRNDKEDAATALPAIQSARFTKNRRHSSGHSSHGLKPPEERRPSISPRRFHAVGANEEIKVAPGRA